MSNYSCHNKSTRYYLKRNPDGAKYSRTIRLSIIIGNFITKCLSPNSPDISHP